MNTNPNNKCVTYLRYSSENQGETSIEYQQLAVTKYACAHNMVIVKHFVDEAYTGRNDKRPEFQKMVAEAKQNPEWNTILLFELSRFARNVADASNYKEQLRDLGINVISITESCTVDDPGGIFENFIDILNAHNSKQTAQRTHASLTTISKRAEHCGGLPPLGYDVVAKKLVVNEVEAETVREIFEMYLLGYSYQKMADALNAKGCRTKLGKPFDKNSFRDLLKQTKYIGTYTWNRRKSKSRNGKSNNHLDKPVDEQVIIPNGCPRIIDDETFQKVQEKMAEKSNGRADSKSRKNYMLGGLKILKCKQCGGYLVGKTSKSHGNTYTTYSCPNKKRKECTCKEVSTTYLDKFVAGVVTNSLLNSTNIDEVNELLKGGVETVERKILRARLQSVDKKIANISRNLENEVSDTLMTKLKSLEIEKGNIEKELEATKVACKLVTKENLKKIRTKLFKMLQESNSLEVKQLLTDYIEEILVDDNEVSVKLAA